MRLCDRFVPSQGMKPSGGRLEPLEREQQMTYTPQLLPRKDALGNLVNVGIIFDEQSKTYVGEIRASRKIKMASGAMRKPIAATGEGNTPSEAADDALKNFISGK